MVVQVEVDGGRLWILRALRRRDLIALRAREGAGRSAREAGQRAGTGVAAVAKEVFRGCGCRGMRMGVEAGQMPQGTTRAASLLAVAAGFGNGALLAGLLSRDGVS